MFVNTYNQEGKEIGQARLPKEVFQIDLNGDLVHQVMVSQMANQRQGTAHTKDRGDVSGGGKKPWRQKGTGRARHGSTRSPIWKGGGVTFGPKNEKVFKREIPKKMRRKALLMVLSAKVAKGSLILLDGLGVKQGKTKEIFEVLKKLPCWNKSTLIALSDYDKKMVLAVRNIPKVKVIEFRELNVLDLMRFQYLLMTKEVVGKIKEMFVKNEKLKTKNVPTLSKILDEIGKKSQSKI